MSKVRYGIQQGTVIFALLMILAGCMLSHNLARIPVTDLEAPYAIAAWQVMDTGGSVASHFPEQVNSPLYEAITGWLFTVLGSSDGLARFLPVLAGILLLVTPWLLRKKLGIDRALLAIVMMMTSPLYAGVVRTADPAILVMLGLVAGLVSLIFAVMHDRTEKQHSSYSTLTGIALAIAFLSGRSFYTGLIVVFSGILGLWLYLSSTERSELVACLRVIRPKAGMGFVLCTLLLGTGVGFAPERLADLFNVFGEWWTGWNTASGYEFSRLLASLAFLNPWILLGIPGIVYAFVRRSRFSVFNLGWLAGAVVLLSLYPGRVRTDIIWLLVPLIALSANFLSDTITWVHTDAPERSWLDLIGLMVVLVALCSYAYLQFAGYSFAAPLEHVAGSITNIGLGIAALTVAVVVIVFYGFGWGWRVAAESTLNILLLAIVCLAINSMSRINYGRDAGSSVFIWCKQATREEMQNTVDLLQTLSIAETGEKSHLQIEILDDSHPALYWALREFDQHGSNNPALDQASIRMLPVTYNQPALAVEYSGLTVSLFEEQGWPGILPADMISWQLKSRAPVQTEDWLILVRSDLLLQEMPGTSDETGTIYE